MSARGVVAAGHPATAKAGAQALREGGNAVDAAVAAVMTSFAAESPLTGLGAGGYMLVHDADRTAVLDFFVATPGLGGVERQAELVPVPVYFTDEVPQVFNVGAASCGVPGMAAGLELALDEFGSKRIGELADTAIATARDGVELNAMQAYLLRILKPIHDRDDEARELYAPGGRTLAEGETFRWPALGDALELFAERGAEPFVTGEVAERVSAFVTDRGGTLSREDLAAYAPVLRQPVRAGFRGREVLTNPLPSAGGTLIAYALELLERAGGSSAMQVIEVMEQAHLARARLGEIADRLGSTTHITAVDGEGRCASVTCSNGTGSGLVVPGTGVHVNNMLGEEDLNPGGFHGNPPETRLPSMMSPTVILRDGEFEAGLGSAGSNRIRSAVLQTILRLVDNGEGAQQAIDAARLHFEPGIVHAEPGIDAEALTAVEAAGGRVERWSEPNLFFGGVQAVSRSADGDLIGGGDPRRAGAVAYA